MAGSWTSTLLNWINCILDIKIDDPSELLNCSLFVDIIKYLDPSYHNHDEDYVKVVKHFLKKEYPYFKRSDNTPFVENVEDVILISSLLLHYSCVKIKDGAVRGTMCQNLELNDQKAIMKFANSLMKHVNITERNLMNSIRASLSDSESFFDESSINLSSISTPNRNNNIPSSPAIIVSPLPSSTPTTYRSRKVFQLEAELGAERFDRNFLQEELNRQYTRIEELENLQKSYVGEIHRLQAELVVLGENTKDNNFANGCNQCQIKDKIYKDQLNSHELEVSRLLSNAVTVEEERDSIKAKLNEAEKNMSNWCAQVLEAETSLNLLRIQLKDVKSENSTLKLTVAEMSRCLEEYRQEHRVNTSIESDDDAFTIGKMLNSSLQSNPESLGKVIDIQLKEQVDNNKMLMTEIDSLKKDNDDLLSKLKSTMDQLEISELDRNDIKQHNQQLNELINKLKQSSDEEIEGYKMKLDRQNVDLKTLTQQLEDLNLSYNNNIIKLDDVSKELIVKSNQIDDLIKNYNHKIKNMENNILELENESSRLSSCNKSLKTQLEEMREDLEKSDNLLSMRNEEITLLQKDNLNLNSMMKQQNNDFSNQINDLKNENCSTKEDLYKQNELYNMLMCDYESLIKEKNNILKNIKTHELRLKDYEKEIFDKLKEIETMFNENEGLKITIDELNNKLLKEKDTNDALEEDNSTLKLNIENKDVELKSYKEVINENERKINELEDAIRLLEVDAKHQQDVYDSKILEYEDLTKEKLLLDNKIQEQEDKLKNYEEEICSYENELQENKNELSYKLKEIEMLSNENDGLKILIEEHKCRLFEESDKNRVLGKNNEKLIMTINEKDEKIKIYKDTVSDNEKSIGDLEKEVKIIEADLNKKILEIEGLLQEKNIIENNFSEQANKLKDYEEEIIINKNELENIKNELKNIHDEFIVICIENEKLKIELDENKTKSLAENESLKKMEEDKISIESQMRECNNKINNYEEIIYNNEIKIKTLEEDIKIQKEDFDKAVSNFEIITKEKKSLEKIIEENNTKFEEYEKSALKNDEELCNMKNVLNEKEEKNNIIIKSNEELKVMLEEQTLKLSKQDERNKLLQEYVNELESIINENNNNLVKYEDDIMQQKDIIDSYEIDLKENIEEKRALEIIIDDYKSKLENYKEKLSNHANELDETKNEMTNRLKEIEILSNENDELRIFIEEHKSKLSNESDKNKVLEENNVNLRLAINERDETLENYKEVINKNEQKIDDLEKQVKIYEADFNKKVCEIETLIQEKIFIENNFSEEAIKVEDYKKQINAYEKELDKFKYELNNKCDEIQIAINENEKLKIDLDENKNKLIEESKSLKKMEEDKILIESQIHECNIKLENYEEAINKNEMKIIALEKDIKIQKENFSTILFDLEMITKDKKSLENIIEENKTKFNKHEEQVLRFEEELSNMKNVFNEKEEEYNIVMSRNEELKVTLEEQTLKLSKQDEQNKLLKENNNALKSIINENNIKLVKYEDDIKQQKGVLDCKVNDFEGIIEEKKALEKTIDDYKNNLENHKEKLSNCVNELEKTKDELTNSLREIDTLSKENDRLKIVVDEQSVKLLGDLEEVKKLEDNNNTLKLSIEKKDVQLKTYEDIFVKNASDVQNLKDVIMKKSNETEVLMKELSEIKDMQISIVQAKNVEIKDLQSLVESLNKNISQYEDDINNKNSQIEALNCDLGDKCKKIESLSVEVSDLKQILDDSKQRLQENIAEMKSLQCDREVELLDENNTLKDQINILNEKLNDVNMRVYTENVRPLVDYDNMLQEKIKLSDELKNQIMEYNKLNEENKNLKSVYNALLLENNMLQNKKQQDSSQEMSRVVADLRNEYEDKLTRMKQKMKQLYQEQIVIYSDKQKEEMAGLESLCKKYSDKIKNYESHVNQLSSELWKVGEKLLMEKHEKDWLKKQLKEKNGSLQSLNSISSTISLPQTKQDLTKVSDGKRMKAPNSVDPKRKLFKVPENVNTESGGLHVSDEEGEVFDNRYINELKSGNFSNMKVNHSGRSSSVYQPDRLSELQWRNSMCLPHLKSSYPAETQFQTFKEEYIKGAINLDDTITSKSQRPKKEVGQTTYKRPGPPTPSKNGGRSSMTGNELREPLKEFNDNSKKTTPSRIKALFMGNNSKSTSRDENTFGTPKSRRLSIFRKPR